MTVNLKKLAEEAKNSAKVLAKTETKKKNAVLTSLASLIEKNADTILEANKIDIKAAQEKGLTEDLIDRLSLQGRLEGLAHDLRRLSTLPDPVGEIFDKKSLDNGLKVVKKRVPLGVLGVIYEARPNVTLDVAALAIKTGNGALLRGGSETLNSNRILVSLIKQALEKEGLPSTLIQFIDSPDRGLVEEMLKLHHDIDMIIPRGGAALHTFCREKSTIPVITGGIGICHLFVDESADVEKSLSVIDNAKTQRPSVCNALDTLLVHEKVASTFIPQVVERLKSKGVTFKCDPKAHEIVPFTDDAKTKDWETEWLGLILGIKVVSGLDEAIRHIEEHSSGHSDGILTETPEHATIFLNTIDSSAVYHNASTRFTDGSALGLGAEVAISTQKLHARGPMGLKELTSYKWVIEGNYTTRD